MVDKKTSAETAAATLTGAEQVRITQSAASVRTTAQAIADLAITGTAISALGAAGTLATGDLMVIDQAGTTKKITLANLIVGTNTQVLFSDSGVPAGNFYLTFDKTTNILTAGQVNIALTSSVYGANCFVAGTIQGAGVFATTPGAVTLANGLNSDINIGAKAFSVISGPTGAFSVGGFTQLSDGSHLTLFNNVAQAMTIVNQDASSTAAQRITTLTGANVVLRSGKSCAEFVYANAIPGWVLKNTN